MENSKSFRKQTKNKKNNEKSNEKNNEKKERSIGKSSKKMEGRVDFDDKLLPNEHLAIYGGNLKRSDQIRFSFLNLDENRQLLVPEKKKVYLRNLTCFRLEISYFRISRISFNQNIWILQLQIFSRKIICPIRLFKTKIFKFNCITEMFILKIFLFFFQHLFLKI